jgi:hypothetical protein
VIDSKQTSKEVVERGMSGGFPSQLCWIFSGRTVAVDPARNHKPARVRREHYVRLIGSLY